MTPKPSFYKGSVETQEFSGLRSYDIKSAYPTEMPLCRHGREKCRSCDKKKKTAAVSPYNTLQNWSDAERRSNRLKELQGVLYGILALGLAVLGVALGVVYLTAIGDWLITG